MNHDCFFDGQGVYYEDEVEGKVYILNPKIMKELTLYGYATKEDVLVTVFRELDGALHSNEEDLRTRIDYLESKRVKSMDKVHGLESQVIELRKEVKGLQEEVKRLQDMVVSYNIQSDDVELAGFFNEIDI